MVSIPRSLRQSLSTGQVIPFVGAGASMAVEHVNGNPLFPSWQELLLNGANWLAAECEEDEAAVVRSLLRSRTPQYLQAAKHLRDYLGEAIWYDFLVSQLDPLRTDAIEESLALTRSIWSLDSNLILTTNYDRVLYWTCPDIAELSIWDIQATAAQARFLRDGSVKKPTVWHLHGHIRNPSEMILTPDGYSRLYGRSDVRYKAALKTLQHQLTAKSFLFIGFSFSDNHFGVELSGMADFFDGSTGPHYALIHEDRLELFRQQELPVKAVPFQDFGAPLLGLLEELGKYRKKQSYEGKSRRGSMSKEAKNTDRQSGSTLEIRVQLSRQGRQSKLDYTLTTDINDLKNCQISGPSEVWPVDRHEEIVAEIEKYDKGLDTGGGLLLEREGAEKIAEMGRKLYRGLFPLEMREIYERIRNRLDSIHIVSNEFSIPWEIIKPFRTGRVTSFDDDFWSMEYSLTRWGSVQHGPVEAIRMKNLLAVDAGLVSGLDMLRGAGQEISYLEELISRHRDARLLTLREPSLANLVQAFRDEDFDFFHFVGHEGSKLSDRPGAALVLQDRTLAADTLRSFAGDAIRRLRPVFFLNAGRSGFGWAQILIDLGVGAFVGPLWLARDSLSSEFSRVLYSGLEQGLTFGDAGRSARVHLRRLDPGALTPLAFAVYAHPRARLRF